MNSEFMLTQGAGQKLEFAIVRNGGNTRHVEWLSTGGNFKQVIGLAEGKLKIVPVSSVIASMKFAVTKRLDPEAFIRKGWKFAERHGKSAGVTEIDFTKIVLVNHLKEGENTIKGEERLGRLMTDGNIHLGADHFLVCWENRQHLPEEWKKFVITFDDDVLLSPNGCRDVLYLCWNGHEWFWHCFWLDNDFDASYRSASLA